MNNLIWKPIKGFECLYLISNNGDIKSIKSGKVLRGGVNRGGYKIVCLYNKGKGTTKTIHRLLMMSFTNNEMNLPVINHIDGNKLNNNLSNLEWCTHSQNCLHSYKEGLNKKRFGSDNHNHRQVIITKIYTNEVEEFDSLSSLGRHFKIRKSKVFRILNRKNNTYMGYVFNYK